MVYVVSNMRGMPVVEPRQPAVVDYGVILPIVQSLDPFTSSSRELLVIYYLNLLLHQKQHLT
jgi:hypothetical protein